MPKVMRVLDDHPSRAVLCTLRIPLTTAPVEASLQTLMNTERWLSCRIIHTPPNIDFY
jgi:hypothetical protein